MIRLASLQLCRCGHAEADHTKQGECAVHRNWWWEHPFECGCEQFVAKEQT